ncbi:hypothetical protein Ga0466249_004171 [Sporomusaceae bacterium BoRhaA]|nr:hypothetical protein [Pelorhabdus rhamnosifermentans]
MAAWQDFLTLCGKCQKIALLIPNMRGRTE